MMRVLQANSKRIFFKHDSLEKKHAFPFWRIFTNNPELESDGIFVLSKKLCVLRMVILEYLTFFKGRFIWDYWNP